MEKPTTTNQDTEKSSNEVKIGKTIFVVTCIYTGDRKINDVLENLVIEKVLETVC